MSADALRQTRIRRALHRPQQIWGGERELMLFSLLLAGGIIIAALNGVATLIGLVLWLACVSGLRRMAKVDPALSKIYLRQLRYGDYYGPFSRPWRMARSPRVY
jgi:type IV secretory pathway TrbD component